MVILMFTMASIYSLVSFKYDVVNLSKIEINILMNISMNGVPAVHFTGNVYYIVYSIGNVQ